MSFDTVFNYSTAIDNLTAEKTSIDQTISDLDDQLVLLNAAPAYSAITASTVDNINAEKARLQSKQAELQAIIDEINVVLALDQAQKDDLYYFYTVVGDEKASFMAKTLFNHAEALANNTITTLKEDVTTASAAKVAVAKILYSNYTLNNTYIRILARFNRYL